MTDNEIIKALEELKEEQEDGYITALEFGGKRDETHEGFLALLGATIDLINRQKAEIERLTDTLNATIAGQETLQRYIQTAKAEAIKEFAERLKKNVFLADVSFGYGKECYTEAVAVIEIDNLVKEMVGDGDG